MSGCVRWWWLSVDCCRRLRYTAQHSIQWQGRYYPQRFVYDDVARVRGRGWCRELTKFTLDYCVLPVELPNAIMGVHASEWVIALMRDSTWTTTIVASILLKSPEGQFSRSRASLRYTRSWIPINVCGVQHKRQIFERNTTCINWTTLIMGITITSN